MSLDEPHANVGRVEPESYSQKVNIAALTGDQEDRVREIVREEIAKADASFEPEGNGE